MRAVFCPAPPFLKQVVFHRRILILTLTVVLLFLTFTNLRATLFPRVGKPGGVLSPGELIDNVRALARKATCSGHRLSPTDPHVIKAYSGHYDPRCEDNSQVIAVIDGKVHYLVNGTECEGFRIVRNTDRDVKTASIGPLVEGQQLKELFYRVACGSDHVTGLTNMFRNPDIVSAKKKLLKDSPPTDFLNVVMVGFDSTSGPGAVHMLGDAWSYFVEEMAGVRLEGMNIVGDGTPQALIPMFTGQNELELPHVRRDQPDGRYVDEVYPFVQYEFQNRGYITSYIERMTGAGTFTYRLRGFKREFTDIDGTAFYKIMEREKGVRLDCFRDQLELPYNLNVDREIISNYPDIPKFLFAFGQMSHESPLAVRAAAPHLLNYLKFLNTDAQRNNTVVILLSDHGPRYAGYRKTYEGRVEERNSFLGIALPEQVRSSFPYAWRNLQLNSDRLVTPYDVHATIRDLLNGIPRDSSDFDPKKRSISLFHAIPSNRTCEGAGIAPHWCLCLAETPLPLDHALTLKAADVALRTINNLTSHLRQLCVEQTLLRVGRSVLMSPNEKILTFSGNTDAHGFEYGFKDKVAGTKSVQLTFATSPLAYVYEVTLNLAEGSELSAEKTSMSILVKYGDNPHCVRDQYPSLREFCICKDKV